MVYIGMCENMMIGVFDEWFFRFCVSYVSCLLLKLLSLFGLKCIMLMRLMKCMFVWLKL